MSNMENYIDTCRTCMKREYGMKCIFNSEVNCVPVSQMLSFTTPLLVRPDDDLPNTLCPNCLQLLISFYKFQQMCIESDQKFRCKPKISSPPKEVSPQSYNIKTQSPQQAPRLPPLPPPPLPPPPPDDYIIPNNNSKFQLGWNSSVSCPVVEVSDDEDIVLKFEYENELPGPLVEDEESDNMIDEYEQFDKLPIIDVKLDGKRSKNESLNKSTEEGRTWNNNENILPEVHECKICGYKCEHQDLLQRHLNTHYTQDTQINSTSKPASKIVQKTTAPIKLAYICTVCKMAFAGQDRLVMHKKTHDKQGLTRNEITPQNINSYNLECKVCKRFYNNQESYDRHSCVPAVTTCNYDGSSKNYLCDENNFYTCNICKRAFPTWEELTKHISEHTIKILYGSDPSSNTTVNVNVNIQTDKTHDCDICSKSFTTWDDFRAHWQQHPENQRGNNTSAQSTRFTVSTSSDCKPPIMHEAASQQQPQQQQQPQVVNDTSDNAVQLLGKNFCSKCYRVFNNWANLKRHMKFKHNVTDLEDDGTEDNNPVNALRAYRICRLYECNVCGKTFDRLGHMIRHKKTHLKKKQAIEKARLEEAAAAAAAEINTKKPYQCDICGIFISNETNLRRHIKRIHEITVDQGLEGKETKLSEEEDIFTCIVCEEELPSRRALVQHLTKHKKDKQSINTEEEGGGEQLKDEKNDVVERLSRTRGKMVVVDDTNSQFICCGRTFKSQLFLDYHRISHNFRINKRNNRNKTTSCKFCNKKCKSFFNLTQHMVIHKLFKCSTCGSRFGVKETLEEHEKTMCNQSKPSSSSSSSQPLEKDLSSPCSFCDKIFEHKSSLIRHLKSTHSLSMVEPTSKTGLLYKCLTCNKSFINIKNLEDHKNCHEVLEKYPPSKHNEQKPQTSEKPNESKPMKKKTDEKEKKTLSNIWSGAAPHKCLECKKVISTRSNLKKHMYRQHRNRFIPLNRKKYIVQCACSKPFDSQTNLFRHYRAHIPEIKTRNENKYTCQLCSIIRPQAWQIRRHMKDSHKVTKKELELIDWKMCEFCKTYFTNEEQLKLHVDQKHENAALSKTVYRCKSCEKFFFEMDVLTKHLKESHNLEDKSEGGIPNFLEETWPTCRICDKPFVSIYGVRRHIENVHHIIQVKNEQSMTAVSK